MDGLKRGRDNEEEKNHTDEEGQMRETKTHREINSIAEDAEYIGGMEMRGERRERGKSEGWK